ncbi:MAG: CRISPR-associated CARF protein Csa3 [Candidatus ainarchaeum sp.]|nr:CRISPR-associated CARF protein Csa3 [Candidatus ainarchaeum sp.]
MEKVLISTIYSIDSIVLAITKESINKLFLLVDEDKLSKEQSEAISKLKDTFGKIILIKEVKIPVYDVYKITKKCVELIDSIPNKPIVNITPSRKTQAIGLLYACFKRSQNIDKIIYMSEDDKELINLPLLDFELNESQLSILKNLSKTISIAEVCEKVDLSRAMVYRIINNLKAKGLIKETTEGIEITESGKIALL